MGVRSPYVFIFNTITYLLTYLLTPWCRVLLEKLTGLQLVKKFPAFHGTRKFITALTSVRHLSLSWASPIQSIYPHPTSWRSIIILSTHPRLGIPSGSRMWVFLNEVFYREWLLAPRPTPKLEDHPRRLSAIAYSIYSQLPSLSEAVPLSATWGRAMPWWQGPTTWILNIN